MPFEVAEELQVSCPDKPGALGAVLKCVAAAGVAVRAFCAYAMQKQGICHLVPANAAKAKAALKKAGYKFTASKVVIGAVNDKRGAGAEIAGKVGKAKVNLEYAYASGTGRGKGVVVLAAGKNTAKLKKTLK